MNRNLLALALTGAVWASAGAASAVVVANATDIRVTSALFGTIPDSYLQVGELLAFDFGNTNVALTGTPTGLSQYSSTSQPNEAIDNVYPAAYDFGDNMGAAGIYHSLGTSSFEFLNISFNMPRTLKRITIYGRLDCCQGRDLYNVTVFGAGNTTLFTGQLDARTNGFATVDFNAPGAAAIPEPATWAMLVMGFGSLGALLRARRRQSPSLAA